MLDMLPHCFGMLAFFGKLESVDEFEVVEVGRYEGAPIPNETYAKVEFTFEDTTAQRLAGALRGLPHIRTMRISVC
jgi:hypothetical protein